MSQPTAGDVHVNTPLTNMSVAYMQDAKNFIADRVFPNLPVQKQSDRYYIYNRGDFNRDEMEVRAPGTESKGSGYDLDNTPTYFANKYAFHKDIPDDIRSNSDSVLDADRDATLYLAQKALIKRERVWAANYFATGKWTTLYTGVSASPGTGTVLQWNDKNATPIEDVRAAKTAILLLTGFEPNVLVLGRQVYDKLADHPEFIDRVKYGQTGSSANTPAKANLEIMAQLFEVDEVLVMNAIYNTAAQGATDSNSFVGGKSALLVYRTKTPGLLVPTGGYTFSWTGYLGASANGTRMKKFRMEQLGSDRAEIEMAFDLKLVGADLGAFFTTIIA